MKKVYYCIVAIIILSACSDGGKANDMQEEENPVFKGNPPVYISEIYLANADFKDEFGNNPAWVEFYNPADTLFNLKGFTLSDNISSTTGNTLNGAVFWTFGDVEILPHSYTIVFFSGRDKPNLTPATDSSDLIKNAVGAWSWADGEGDPKGNSTAKFNFSKTTGLNGTLNSADNFGILNYSSAVIMLKLSGWDNSNILNISNANQILLRGNLAKNSKLEIRLAQNGVEEWKAWATNIKGSGIENDLYVIDLPSNTLPNSFPNLSDIYGLRFANPQNVFGEIKFSFNSIVAQKSGGYPHASFQLNKNGGKLFLLDTLWQIRDSVQYPAETKELSFAKNFDTEKWAFSKPPTPNAANSSDIYTEQAEQPAPEGFPKSGYYETELIFTIPGQTEQEYIACDSTGALPNENSFLKSGVSLTLTKTTILRCSQFKSEAFPSEAILRTYIIGERKPNLPVVSIAIDPIQMFDSTSGIYATGLNASSNYPYFGANYWEEIEVPVQIDFFENGAKFAWTYPASLGIFGNYSRANPKKSVVIEFKEKSGQKNLKYALFPEYPELQKFKNFILRNNGGNFGKDYIRDMLMSSLTDGLGLDYQKGRAAIVYYNGKYFGIHNLRERSNAEYFETNYGIDKNNIDLVKGNGEVSHGSDADFQSILSWHNGLNAMSDTDVAELSKKIDLNNYANYIQSEIYFLNKDWLANNLKRWRSNLPETKWKWFLYDTDFGFGGYDDPPGVKMFDFATEANGPEYPNPPHSTLITRRLFANENYRNTFINRFSFLLATQFAPAKVSAKINSLMQAIASEIPLDQKRWNLSAAKMDAELEVIREFGKNRPTEMQKEIEDFFDLGKSYKFTLSKTGNAKVFIHDLPIFGDAAVFTVYEGVPVKIKMISSAGETIERVFEVVSDTAFVAGY